MNKMRYIGKIGILCGMPLLLSLVLFGCGSRAYEKVAMQAESSQAVEIQIGSRKEIQIQSEKEIVIEQEQQTGEAATEKEVEDAAGLQEDSGMGDEGAHEKRFTMLFSGDILLSDHVLAAYQKGGGIGGVLDPAYRKEIAAADMFFANEEFPFSSRGTQAPDKQFTFRLPPEKVSIFQEIGVDGVTLANNHALDYGTDALLDTCEILDQAGIPHTGAGADLAKASKAVTYELSGVKVAVIGATRVIPVASWAASGNHPGMLAAYDPAILLEQIRRLKKEQDLVIVCIHWGIEREERPNDIQKNLGRQMIDAGADLVIGSHPHVLQGIEYYKGKPIVYSLGNFIFGSSIPRTALLKVQYDGTQADASGDAGKGLKLSLVPGTSGAGYTHVLDNEEKRQEFFRYMKSISFGVSYDEDGNVCEE